MMDHWVKARGPGCPCVNPLAQQPFRFDHLRGSPVKDASGDGGSHHQPSPHWPQRGWDCNRYWRDQRPASPRLPSPSPDHGFECNRSSLSTASSMLSRSDRSDESQHSQQGRWHQEDRAHMMINLLVFKEEDAKDEVTYQSWRCDRTVYRHAGCRDHTLLPYAARSLQGYPGKLVQSSGMDITLDNVLTILDKHYNNVKTLDALNQDLYQLWMADKETVLDWGIHLWRHLQVLAASFPDCFPPDQVAELKRDCFYGGLPKWLKAMVPYLKAGLQVRTYSDYLRASQEAKKEDSLESHWDPRTWVTDTPPKARATSFFPWGNSRATSPSWRSLLCVWHIWKKRMPVMMKAKSDDPGGIGVTEEFMVCLAWAVKDTQVDEKCCYHCSSLEHFICNCLLVKTSREKIIVKQQGGDGIHEGSLDPSNNSQCIKEPPEGGSQRAKTTPQTPFMNPDPFQCWHRVENIARVRINEESCMALLDNDAQINTIMPKYISDHSLQMGLITDLLGTKVTCVGLGNAYMKPLGYVIIQVQADQVKGYDFFCSSNSCQF